MRLLHPRNFIQLENLVRPMIIRLLFLGWLTPYVAMAGGDTELAIQQNRVVEWIMTSQRAYANPCQEVDLDAIVTSSSESEQRIPAFWAGQNEWRFRWASPRIGTYAFRTVCSDQTNTDLHDRQGTITVTAYKGENPLYAHGPVRLSSDRRHFEHTDGTPFLWLADSWWHGMTARFEWPNDFHALTEDRKEKGFSVIQFAAGYPCDITEFDPRGANEAGFPTSRDYRRINPMYFDRVDLRVQHLVENGLMPNVLGTWGYYLPWFGVENMKRYWRYIIARYGAYPVTWTVAGETTLIYYETNENPDEVRQFQRDGWAEVARYIKETDPYRRILTAHPGPASGRFQPISDMSLLDFVMVQPGHNGWDTLPAAMNHLHTAQAKFPDRPVMQGEVCFEGMHGGGSDAKLQRLLFWMNMLSGTVGHCYGADAIWQFNTKKKLFGPSPGGYAWGNATWEEACHWKGSFYVGLGRKILQRFPWSEFEPHPEWIEPAADKDDVQDTYAAGIPGKIRLFYFPRGVMPWGQKYTVRALNENEVYQAVFIDPRTGEEFPLKDYISHMEQWTIPPAPILQDWLLSLGGKLDEDSTGKSTGQRF